MLTPGADPVRKVSIIPRGQALGVTLSTPEDDRFNYSEDELRAKIRVSAGGRAAEELVFGEATTGAESDIQQVTRIARGMVERWGMSEKVGFLTVAPQDGQSPLLPGADPVSEATQELIDGEVRRIVDDEMELTEQLLSDNREQARLAGRGAARAGDAGRGRRLRGRGHRARRGRGPMSDLIDIALAEDIGEGDLTTRAVVPDGAEAKARISQKAPGVIAGLRVAEAVFQRVDPELVFVMHCPQGKWREAGAVAEISRRGRVDRHGRAGGAELPRPPVRAWRRSRPATCGPWRGRGCASSTPARPCPGCARSRRRRCAPAAARATGAACTTRSSSRRTTRSWPGESARPARLALEAAPAGVMVEVECATLDEVRDALDGRREPHPARQHEHRTSCARRWSLPAAAPSSRRRAGVTLDTVRAVAETGVDYISVGALTHSAPALDVSLLLEPL